MRVKNKKLIVIVMLLTLFITTGFTSFNKNPQKVYRVYLKGKSIGLIESKEELENYINKKQSEIKKKYNVDKVYLPKGGYTYKESSYLRHNDIFYAINSELEIDDTKTYMIEYNLSEEGSIMDLSGSYTAYLKCNFYVK